MPSYGYQADDWTIVVRERGLANGQFCPWTLWLLLNPEEEKASLFLSLRWKSLKVAPFVPTRK